MGKLQIPTNPTVGSLSKQIEDMPSLLELDKNVGQPNLMAQDSFQNFVKRNFMLPASQISGRAMIPDPSTSLKAIAGVERLVTNSLFRLTGEIGPGGENVYETQNKDARIRLVGNWTVSTNAGTRVKAQNVGDFVEVAFYGTGLNILQLINAGARDLRVTVDTGAEGANIYVAGSGVLDRDSNPNQVTPISSGLTLGFHTIKVRNASISATLDLYGIEILNERSNLAVLSGTAYAGTKQETLLSTSTSAFSAGVSGTRGARIVKYLKDGVISQVVREASPTSLYMDAADHTNEEVRRINFREFGTDRSDDFSTVTTSDTAYPLEDGTTTLLVNNPFLYTGLGDEALGMDTDNTGFAVLTFVGTGLDITWGSNSAGTQSTTNSYEVFVDGVSVSTSWPSDAQTTTAQYKKLCSGLPYGTHTVSIRQNVASAWRLVIQDYFIWTIKKPAVPADAIEITDYCLMSNYTVGSSGRDVIAQGVLRKSSNREMTYIGTWAALLDATAVIATIGGITINSATTGSSFKYTFWGTGFEWRFSQNATSSTWTVDIDGSTNVSGFTNTNYGAGITSFTTSTGTLVTSTTIAENGINITGLTLGLHTITITKTAGTGILKHEAIDVVTPIHNNNLDTRVIGSTSINDTRKFSPLIDKPDKVDLSKAKAWIQFDGTNAVIISSYNISSAIRVSTGYFIVYFSKKFKDRKYCVNACTGMNATTVALVGEDTNALSAVNIKLTSACGITCKTTSANALNNSTFYATFYGELEDEFDNT